MMCDAALGATYEGENGNQPKFVPHMNIAFFPVNFVLRKGVVGPGRIETNKEQSYTLEPSRYWWDLILRTPSERGSIRVRSAPGHSCGHQNLFVCRILQELLVLGVTDEAGLAKREVL